MAKYNLEYELREGENTKWEKEKVTFWEISDESARTTARKTLQQRESTAKIRNPELTRTVEYF